MTPYNPNHIADPPINDFAKWLDIEASYTIFGEPHTLQVQIYADPDNPDEVEEQLTETLRQIHRDEIITKENLQLTDYCYPHASTNRTPP